MIPLARWKLDELARAWSAATPFPHVVIDELVDPETLQALLVGVSQEPHYPNRGEIYDFMASAPEVAHPTLRAFQSALGSPETLAAVRAISGREVRSVDLRSYVYLPGSYLLPHADSRASLGRLVAFAFYLYTKDCAGGELELYTCEMAGDDVVHATPAQRIEPRDNRVVLFDVTAASLHQVREVLAGHRISLTGWYLG